jgi:hypothetical protein
MVHSQTRNDNFPNRSLVDRVASKPATMSLASHLTKPTVVASSSSVTLDNIPSQVAAPLPYDDSGVPTRDIPMDESMEVLDLNKVPELEESRDAQCIPFSLSAQGPGGLRRADKRARPKTVSTLWILTGGGCNNLAL